MTMSYSDSSVRRLYMIEQDWTRYGRLLWPVDASDS